MQKLVSDFLLTISFFSRIPLPRFLGNRISHDASLAAASAFFPVAGFVIGLFPAAVWLVASHVLPLTVAAGLAMTVSLLLTGALHEDGLADCADGLGATSDREKALEIMRDSRIGTYGALALLLSVGIRWAALAALSIGTGMYALLIAHTASRSSMVIAMRLGEYARPKGLGKLASGDISPIAFATAISLALLAGSLFGHFSGLLAVVFAFVTAICFLLYLKRRLGGYTGDGLGAIQQISEITIMVVLAGLWA